MSDSHSNATSSDRPLLITIVAIVSLYILAALFQLPQKGTAMILASAEGHHASEDGGHDHPGEEKPTLPIESQGEDHATDAHPPYYMVTPFVLLLGAIAVFPLMHVTEHWWESNLNRFLVAGALGILTLGYYAVMHTSAVDRHFLGHAIVEPLASGISWNVAWTIFQNAIFNEYIPFIMLLFSLYTICGGIRIEGDMPAHPLTNSTFLGLGGLLASFIGTTGAAMLLIRPLLETNKERKHVRHTVVLFIFIVCNCGGCLLPIGDPPLFLGYLQGVEFLWTISLWREWLFVNGSLLAVYFLWDHFYFYPRESKTDVVKDETQVRKIRIPGLWPNAPLLFGVVLATALLDPSKPVPGTDWHPWLYLREICQLSLVGLSLKLGSPKVRQDNQFNFGAIIEVAALFVGIFICMQPALQILGVKGADLGIDTPQKFFWATGGLSSVLDNAPTYLVFFQTAKALPAVAGVETMAGVPIHFLTPISLGAVFLGAMTYIGNGPNFMVKTIAEKSGVKMPSFFGYVVYSMGILFPIFVLMTFLFVK